LKHLLVTQNFHPEGGGMARRYTELVRAYGDPMDVSTLAHDGLHATTSFFGNAVHRQPFALDTSKRATSQARWARWLVSNSGSVDVLHCGEIRPVGYAVGWAHIRTRIPYVLYVNGGDLLREKEKTSRSIVKRISGRYLLQNASGVVANSAWTASLARDLMGALSIESPPPVAAIDLGTDPKQFHPSHDKGRLRSRWGVAQAPLMITVARLVPHKGQDMGIEALARLRGEFPDLRYVLVGTGHDESRLRALAAERGVSDRVIFAGALSDDELSEAYATSTVYVGFSRLDQGINVEGFGIAFVEASASGVPVVAGDSGGVRSAVRDGETGWVVAPTDISAMVERIAPFLRSREMRDKFGQAGRRAVESHYNWDRVGRETREFVNSCVRLSGNSA
jgi:phosphatidylinositol alpha-1,6-mannosyltransferase